MEPENTQPTATEEAPPDDDKRIAFGGAIKALGDDRIGGYLVSFTGPDHRDLYGEYFDAATDFGIDDFNIVDNVVLFHHGMDETIGTHGIGKVIKAKIDEKGIWIEARLKERDEYTEWVKELLAKKALGWSSGALPQSVRVSEDGHIEAWKIIEASATHTPAEPTNTGVLSIRSLQPAQPRERVPDDVREADDGTGSESVNAEDKPQTQLPRTPRRKRMAASKPAVTRKRTRTTKRQRKTTHTRRTTMSKSIMGALLNVNAYKAMEESDLEEMRNYIEQKVAEYVDAAIASIRGEVDSDAIAAANEDVVEEVGKMFAEHSPLRKADFDDVDDAVTELVNSEDFIESVVTVWAKGYNKQREINEDRKKRLIADAVMDAGRFAPARSKKRGAGSFNGGGFGSANIQVNEPRKYQHLTASQMAMIARFKIHNAVNAGVPERIALQNLDDDFVRAMAHKCVKFAYSEPFVPSNPNNGKSIEIAQRDNHALQSSVPFRADEINASNIAGQGTEWVGDFWDTTLWNKVRYQTQFETVLSKGMWEQEIPQGYDNATFPTEGADPIAYTAPQANDLDATNRVEVTANIGFIGTGNVSVTPGELKLATAVTNILDEDSIINMAAQTERQLQEAAREYVDRLMINGDTETADSTNINLIDATPGTGLSTPYYIASNGFRKLPLITATGQGRDAGNSLSITDYHATMKLFDGEQRQRKENMVFLVDADTHHASLLEPTILTEDVRRAYAATLLEGNVINLWGVDVLEAGFLPETNTAGMVSNTGSNNTQGTILAVYAPYWGVGWKRRITLESSKDIRSGATVYVMSMRIGFVARGNNAAALSYNVANA